MNKSEFRLKIFSLSERLYPMVSRMLGSNGNAEDAIQEIMMKLWIKRHKLDNHPNITGFVLLTARNYCIDILRKKRLEIEDTFFELEVLKSDYHHDQLEWGELNNMIKKILKSLPKKQKEVLIMRDLEGYEFAEISAVTQLKIEHVRVLLSRARKEVSVKLEKYYGYER